MTAKCLSRVLINPPIECASGESFKICVSYPVDTKIGDGVITSVEKVSE